MRIRDLPGGDTIERMKGIVWTELPGIEYLASVKIALRPRSMLKPDFPNRLKMSREFNKGDAVLELGANIGSSSKELPRFAGHVYSFEPSPKHYKFLLRNTKGIPNISRYNAAVSGKTQRKLAFTVRYGGGSLFATENLRGDETVVNVIGINDLPFRFNAIIADCEGAEVPIFESFEHWDMVDKIYCETHWVDGKPTLPIVKRILENHYPHIYLDKDVSGRYDWVVAKRTSLSRPGVS